METLTLEQAYYIAQMVAAVILILSVVYLALQVHQNTHAIRLSNFQAVSASWANIINMLTQNEEVADIYLRGMVTYDELNEIEQFRFRMMGMQLIRTFSENFEQQHEGAVRKARQEASQRAHLDVMQTPVCKWYGHHEGTGFQMIFKYTWITSLNDQRQRQSTCPPNRKSR